MHNKSKTILIITDGIGCKPDSTCNAFKDATKPTYDRLFKDTPRALISTHGLAVGLPEGQMGNSEVGHMTIGSGRILYQDLVKMAWRNLQKSRVKKYFYTSLQMVEM
jgi:2,3-bisphosphoglycerate-independent phosphoglycerate mutase